MSRPGKKDARKKKPAPSGKGKKAERFGVHPGRSSSSNQDHDQAKRMASTFDLDHTYLLQKEYDHLIRIRPVDEGPLVQAQ